MTAPPAPAASGRSRVTAAAAASVDVLELVRGLLAGAVPVGAQVRPAIDAALRADHTDAALHAAALLLAHAEGTDLGLGRSLVRGWIPGLDELVERGHLDAAAYAAPRLRAAYPRLAYLDYMELVLRQMPRAVESGRQPLSDDLERDVQVVAAPGADTVVLAFSGARHRLGLPLNLLDRWFAPLGAHVVYLRDRRKVGYARGIPELGSDMTSTTDGLLELVGDLGARRVVCTGNSAGGTGALRYARALGAERVLALAPITGGPAFQREVPVDLLPSGLSPWPDLVPAYRADAGVRVRILYGEQNASDREDCERMAGLPNVTVEAIPHLDSHHVVSGLLRAKRLGRVLRWLVA